MDMDRLMALIDQLAEFGTNPNVEVDEKEGMVKGLLVDIYREYLIMGAYDQEADIGDSPDFDYKKIRENVSANFPDFGMYWTVYDSHKLLKEPELGVGDAIDDVAEFIMDMLKVKWQFEHVSPAAAKWVFEFHMQAHSEEHLVEFLKYLKNKEDSSRYNT